MWIPNNRFMRKAGVPDSYERTETYVDAVMADEMDAPGASPERRAAYLNEGPRMIDFLVDHGVKLEGVSYWPDYCDEKPYPGDVGTYGGVVTDAYARVLKEDGSVIEGLYATGVTTASVFGRAYPDAGASIGRSFVWGYVAAKHAAGAGNCAGADVPSEQASA